MLKKQPENKGQFESLHCVCYINENIQDNISCYVLLLLYTIFRLKLHTQGANVKYKR